MKKRHVINIGLPRSGTTWLWHQLLERPGFADLAMAKENPYLFFNPNFKVYWKQYCDYEYSANFHTAFWMLDRYMIQQLTKHATHVSMIVRNPYDFISRYFDWVDHSMSPPEFVDWAINSGIVRYYDIVSRWKGVNQRPFLICYFEDLVQKPTQFLEQYYRFLGETVKLNTNTNYNKMTNASPKAQKSLVEFSEQQQQIINLEIDRFIELTGRSDLDRWKR